MKLMLALALFFVAMQEHTLPLGHYCQNHKLRPQDKRAHECHCDYVCVADADGIYDVKEDSTCKVYCHHNQCSCHPEEPCPHPS